MARSYVVTVQRAWGLAKADRIGKSDPFVSVKVKYCNNDHLVWCVNTAN